MTELETGLARLNALMYEYVGKEDPTTWYLRMQKLANGPTAGDFDVWATLVYEGWIEPVDDFEEFVAEAKATNGANVKDSED